MSDDIQTRWADLWSRRWEAGVCRLRFELGDALERPIPRALEGIYRAIAVADAIFTSGCIGVVATRRTSSDLPPRHWPPRHADVDEEFADGFAVLQSMGFEATERSSWSSSVYDDDDADAWVMRSFDLTESLESRDILVWNSAVLELPIWPSSPDRSFLLHPTLPVLLHVYDDRGMDVIADDTRNLRPIYEGFDGWLLDYDRPRMKQVFA